MPKREKTPDPHDDEPRFLIVNYPYPAHANLEELKDTITLARWLGCIISPRHIIALHHKPSARNMVIVEIERARPREEWRRLLGGHKWDDILISPTPDEKGKISRVYFCQYSSGRQVQKSGWKRVYFEDTWFKPDEMKAKNKFIQYNEDDWERIKRNDSPIRFPYPLSVYCELPTEDPTNTQLCRPLPVDHFPRGKSSAADQKYVVGSDEWVDTKLKPESASDKAAKPANAQKLPMTESLVVEPPSERRGRTQARPTVVGIPFPPPGLLLPPGVTLPPGLLNSSNTTTNSSASSDQDCLEFQTAAALRLDGDYCEPEVVPEGLGSVSALQVDQPLASSEVVNSLWNDGPKEEEENPPLCRIHGRVCSKGICSQYSRQLKEQKQKQKLEVGTANRGRGSRGGMPSSNRGRNGGSPWSQPHVQLDGKQGARTGRGAAKREGNENRKTVDVDEPEAAGSSGGGDRIQADDLVSVTTEQSNAWETTSMGPW